MDNVIYSASPFQTFLGSFGMIAFFFLLGIAGLGFGILRRKESMIARIATSAAGGFLILVGIVTTYLTIQTMLGGSETVVIKLNDKFVAEDNCGDGGTCLRYVLETNSGPKYYDLQVNQSTYEKAQVGGCYRLIYYPGRSMLGAAEYQDTYESVSNITRLEAVEQSMCG
jgi:hypothetical protein